MMNDVLRLKIDHNYFFRGKDNEVCMSTEKCKRYFMSRDFRLLKN